MIDDRTSGNFRECRLGDEIPADTEAKTKVDELLEPFAREYYEYCRYRMGVLTDAVWCVGERVYANLVEVAWDVFGRIRYSAPLGYEEALRVFCLPVWVTPGLGADQIRLMVPAGTGAEGASGRRFNLPEPSMKPMQTGSNCAEEANRRMEVAISMKVDLEVWEAMKRIPEATGPFEGVVDPGVVDPGVVDPGDGSETWHDRPSLLGGYD